MSEKALKIVPRAEAKKTAPDAQTAARSAAAGAARIGRKRLRMILLVASAG